MRLSPSKEAVDYLLSIGVSKTTIGVGGSGASPARRRSAWPIVAAIILVLTLAAGVAAAEESPATAGGSVPEPAHPDQGAVLLCASAIWWLARSGGGSRPSPAPAREEPLSSTELVQRLVLLADNLPDQRVKPSRPDRTWGMGFATHKGNVRAENQDYGTAFRIAGHDVLVVADGCGGLPDGRRAAYRATVAAAAKVARYFGAAPDDATPAHAVDAAGMAVLASARRLRRDAAQLSIPGSRGAMRTTLIVVVASPSEIAYAYIGDGGACIVKADGRVHHFLRPQKADGHAANVLAASLGPLLEGEFVCGVVPREPGDLVVAGTDGVFDRVDDRFPHDVLKVCNEYGGDLQTAAEQIVEQLASFQDEVGYLCDDNLTLGFIGTGEPATQKEDGP